MFCRSRNQGGSSCDAREGGTGRAGIVHFAIASVRRVESQGMEMRVSYSTKQPIYSKRQCSGVHRRVGTGRVEILDFAVAGLRTLVHQEIQYVLLPSP